jgi:hypothetical protein
MQHRRSIFSRTSWKVSAEHRDRKDVSGPTVRAKNQSMKQKKKSVWTVGTDDGTNQKIMFHYSERSIDHVDWYYVFMMTWKMWAQWGLIETTGLKRKSEGVDNQAVSPSHDSWSSSSEVPHWAAAFRIQILRLNPPHWLKLGDGGSDAPRRWCVTVLFCFVQICWRWQSSILINFNCVPLPLGSESIHRAAPMQQMHYLAPLHDIK